MANDLSIPQEISSDGHELWDWAGRLSQHTQRLHNARVLREKIWNAKRKCGSCEHWMHSNACPKEVLKMTGYYEGPSMNAPICQKFEMKSSTAESIAKWEVELAALEAKP